MGRHAATADGHSEERFTGRIAGFGTHGARAGGPEDTGARGPRIVIGMWARSPYGRFADVMIEHPDGRRVLLAPDERVATYVSSTYTFDEVRLVPVRFLRVAGGMRVVAGATASGIDGTNGEMLDGTVHDDTVHDGTVPSGTLFDSTMLDSTMLDVTLRVGPITTLGRVLRGVPERLATDPRWLRAVDPVAARLVPGAHTSGSAGGGRREYYGVTTIRALDAVHGTLEGRELGGLAPLDPPVRFGFGSAPATPSLVDLTTIIRSPHPHPQ